jgi:hypothetical protein
MRFTHANRHCPDHPYEALKRSDDEFILNQQPEEQSTEILKWLQKYREERQQLLQQAQLPSPNASRKTPKRPLSLSSLSSSSGLRGNEENKRRIFSRTENKEYKSNMQENCDTTSNSREMIAMSPSKVARKGLMCEVDMNAGTAENVQTSTPTQHYSVSNDGTDLSSFMGSPVSTNKPKHCRPKIILWKEPIDDNDDNLLMNECSTLRERETSHERTFSCTSTQSPVKKLFNPKKKWLREAWQEDLGTKPLDYGSSHPLFPLESCNWQMTSTGHSNANPNQSRPSVLIMAKGANENLKLQNE